MNILTLTSFYLLFCATPLEASCPIMEGKKVNCPTAQPQETKIVYKPAPTAKPVVKKAPIKVAQKSTQTPAQVKVVERVVKEYIPAPTASGKVETQSSSSVTIDQRKVYLKDPETESLRHKLRMAEHKLRLAEDRATKAEAKANGAQISTEKNRFQARRYYERYRLLKDSEGMKTKTTSEVSVSKSSNCCGGGGSCDQCDNCCGGSGFYLGIIAGAAPHTVKEYCPEIDGYEVVGQTYRPVLGLRVSGVSKSGFAGGLSILTNRSALIDLNFRIN